MPKETHVGLRKNRGVRQCLIVDRAVDYRRRLTTTGQRTPADLQSDRIESEYRHCCTKQSLKLVATRLIVRQLAPADMTRISIADHDISCCKTMRCRTAVLISYCMLTIVKLS